MQGFGNPVCNHLNHSLGIIAKVEAYAHVFLCSAPETAKYVVSTGDFSFSSANSTCSVDFLIMEQAR